MYRDIWIASIGEVLRCQRETSNPTDRYAVAIVKDSCIVGHLPRKISAICSIFIRRGGGIDCHITGCRRYSRDLLQGGLEVPCLLVFTGEAKYNEKAKPLVELALQCSSSVISNEKSDS